MSVRVLHSGTMECPAREGTRSIQSEPNDLTETVDEDSDMEIYSLYCMIPDKQVDPPIMINVEMIVC